MYTPSSRDTITAYLSWYHSVLFARIDDGHRVRPEKERWKSEKNKKKNGSSSDRRTRSKNPRTKKQTPETHHFRRRKTTTGRERRRLLDPQLRQLFRQTITDRRVPGPRDRTRLLFIASRNNLPFK